MIVYDFQDMQRPPLMRMAVYVRLNSSAHEGGSLSVRFENYTWNIDKPLYVFDPENGYRWIGSTHIMPAAGSEFKAGRYHVCYTDQASMKAETDFFLDAPRPVSNLDTDAYKTEKQAVFDSEGFLLGYDIEKEPILRSEISEKYPGAFFTRKILLAPDGLSLIVEPPAFLSEAHNVLAEGGMR
ncbi:hypothetical protein H0R92_08625 [Treponema sp. OMZ 840]|uniref:hypothetical protein n=1 Tax=Treponema sp. OMZ 840 TaxID=244313 RepID=UPI003D8B6F9D